MHRKVRLTDTELERLINESVRKNIRLLLNESDTRIKRFENLVREKFANVLSLDSPVTDPQFRLNNDPNTTWFQYLVYNFRHHFGLMSNADVKYLYPFALIAYSDEVGFDMRDDNAEQLSNLEKVIKICKQQPELFEKYIKNGTTYQKMMEVFGPIMNEHKSNMENELANTKFGNGNGYRILSDIDYDTAHEYGRYSCSSSILCFTDHPNMWETFTNKGKNKCYLCLKDGWENIPEQHTGENNSAYDAYGLSMIFVFVTPDGEIYHSNTRWNHRANYPGYGVDNAFDWLSLSKVLGVNAKAAMPGYTQEELKKKGVRYITFEMAKQMLESGVPPEEVFDDMDDFYGGFAMVKLNDKCGFINQEGREITEIKYDDVRDFHDGFARVEFDGKWYFMDGKGMLYDRETRQPVSLPQQRTSDDVISERVRRMLRNALWKIVY